MDIRDEDLRKNELDYRYKDLTEEEFVDKENLDEDNSSKNNFKQKITKEDIMKSVMEQVKKVKRDDETQEIKQDNDYSWFNEYQKQPIEINKDRVRVYLENYNDLDEMIKYREENLISGKIKPESKSLEVDKIEDFNFLSKTNMSKEDFYSKVDYKLREMKFYKSNLGALIRNLKLYGFLVYQFVVLKYFLNLGSKTLKDLIPFKNLEYLDNLAIEYLTNKLIEEYKKECQK